MLKLKNSIYIIQLIKILVIVVLANGFTTSGVRVAHLGCPSGFVFLCPE
jgi:hypothetical protein